MQERSVEKAAAEAAKSKKRAVDVLGGGPLGRSSQSPLDRRLSSTGSTGIIKLSDSDDEDYLPARLPDMRSRSSSKKARTAVVAVALVDSDEELDDWFEALQSRKPSPRNALGVIDLTGD